MTNIGHFRAVAMLLENEKDLPVKMWMAPPTRMDADVLKKEGLYSIYCRAGVRVEIPGCSLCMGNQARVKDNANVISTSTRNFPDRIGNKADVFLGSAELAAVSAVLGRLPTLDEYLKRTACLSSDSGQIYRYLDFQGTV
jgi:aconitate hydratase 2/2-methylisocitrate dehydratase